MFNFGPGAKRSYIFLPFEAENVLKICSQVTFTGTIENHNNYNSKLREYKVNYLDKLQTLLMFIKKAKF